jgi:two-component system phosphate regulon sensor histidine kinase PhoR
MKYTITVHKVIAVVSFLVLSAVQFFLVYNTYELKNRQYYLEEKETIKKAYGKSIRADLMFPGGAKMLDSAIYKNLPEMEKLFRSDSSRYEAFAQQIANRVFHDLHRAENIDSLLAIVSATNHIRTDLSYLLTVDVIEVVYGDGNYIPFYKKGVHYRGIADSLQTPYGIWLGGTLKEPSENNKITTVSVEGLADRTYRIHFSLYVDTSDRHSMILQRMMPTFALSLFSILAVVLLFFVTFRNWIRQKKLSEMKSDFINSITHEFHTPLSAIMVANKTLQNEKIASSRETVQPLTQVIQRQSDRLKALIGPVLDITTLQQVVLKKEVRSLHHLLDEVLLDYRLNVADAPVALTLTKNAEKDEVLLDPFWFATILLNIFDNAIKYNQRDLKEIVVTTGNDKKNILISIADNGIGMTEETRRHLFDKFYRNTQGLAGDTRGLGLGLYYVKRAVDAHQWKIDIKSEVGSGTVFTITMPLHT